MTTCSGLLILNYEYHGTSKENPTLTSKSWKAQNIENFLLFPHRIIFSLKKSLQTPTIDYKSISIAKKFRKNSKTSKKRKTGSFAVRSNEINLSCQNCDPFCDTTSSNEVFAVINQFGAGLDESWNVSDAKILIWLSLKTLSSFSAPIA